MGEMTASEARIVGREFGHCGGRSRSPGLALVEILAALVLMGTFVAAMVVAQGSSVRQIHDARLQVTAREIADELIASWRLEEKDWTVERSGDVDTAHVWFWRRWSDEVDIAPQAKALRVTLELNHRPTEGSEWRRTYAWLVENE